MHHRDGALIRIPFRWMGSLFTVSDLKSKIGLKKNDPSVGVSLITRHVEEFIPHPPKTKLRIKYR
jgi:hypothetical protein